jgi:hypothetical protein
MKLFITTLLIALASAQDTPSNRQLPALDLSALVQGVAPNRQLPALDPTKTVQGVQAPQTTPVFKPKPIPPNRKVPVISKADIVMAVTDKLGFIVDNMAERLVMDLDNILTNLPNPPNSPNTGKRAMEAQQAIQAADVKETEEDSDAGQDDYSRD